MIARERIRKSINHEQIRTFLCYPNLSVKIVATHAGISPSRDGATHQATEDIAVMSVMPNMTVIVPTDYNMTKAAIRAAIEHKGPVYIRLGRDKLPIIYDEDMDFKIGKAIDLKKGK